MTKGKKKGNKVSNLASSWDVTDEEEEEIKTAISQMWGKWKPQKESSPKVK